MTLYFAGATLVFSLTLNAFLKDDSTPKNHIPSWITIALATLIWPVVFPSLIRKKLQREEKKLHREESLNLDYLN